MDSTDPARERVTRWTRRSVELGDRIRDLHDRNAQLSAYSGPPDLEERRPVGSTPDQVAEARALARTANIRAFEAKRRTAVMRLRAATAHDRAAQLHEMLADANQGDVQEHRERAAAHRQDAREDRTAAARIFGSQQVQQP